MEPDLAPIDLLADWSSWLPFASAVEQAPLLPGVYMARSGERGPLVYVGRAGERRGRGVRGRLAVYASGKAMVSGLGEAVTDRALADPLWLRERLAQVDNGRPERATVWARAALARADLHVRWATCPDGGASGLLERQILTVLKEADLWNRAR